MFRSITLSLQRLGTQNREFLMLFPQELIVRVRGLRQYYTVSVT